MKLTEDKAQKLRTWKDQLLMLQQAAMPPAVPPLASGPQAVPEAPPVSPMLPNAPNQ